MKKVMLTGIASLWLFTGALCSSPIDLTQLIANTQADAVTACSFMPDVATISAIFATGNPALQTGAAIASAICAAVAPHAAGALTAMDNSVPGAKVAGVPVKGVWVKKP